MGRLFSFFLSIKLNIKIKLLISMINQKVIISLMNNDISEEKINKTKIKLK